MKTLITLIGLIIITTAASGQSLERQVIGAAGSAIQNGSAGLSQTIGETVTATASTVSVVLTQGFQQPETEILSSVFTPWESDINISVFPNPTSDILRINSNLYQSGIHTLQFVVYDMHGKVILKGEVNAGMDEISVSGLAASSYTLSLASSEKSFSHVTRFVKL